MPPRATGFLAILLLAGCAGQRPLDRESYYHISERDLTRDELRVYTSRSIRFIRYVPPYGKRLSHAHDMLLQGGRNHEVVYVPQGAEGEPLVQDDDRDRIQVRFASVTDHPFAFVYSPEDDRYRLESREGRIQIAGGEYALDPAYHGGVLIYNARDYDRIQRMRENYAAAFERHYELVERRIDVGPSGPTLAPSPSEASLVGVWQRDDGLFLRVRREGYDLLGTLSKKGGEEVATLRFRQDSGVWVGVARWPLGAETRWELGATAARLEGRCQWIGLRRGKVVSRGWSKRSFTRLQRVHK